MGHVTTLQYLAGKSSPIKMLASNGFLYGRIDRFGNLEINGGVYLTSHNHGANFLHFAIFGRK